MRTIRFSWIPYADPAVTTIRDGCWSLDGIPILIIRQGIMALKCRQIIIFLLISHPDRKELWSLFIIMIHGISVVLSPELWPSGVTVSQMHPRNQAGAMSLIWHPSSKKCIPNLFPRDILWSLESLVPSIREITTVRIRSAVPNIIRRFATMQSSMVWFRLHGTTVITENMDLQLSTVIPIRLFIRSWWMPWWRSMAEISLQLLQELHWINHLWPFISEMRSSS